MRTVHHRKFLILWTFEYFDHTTFAVRPEPLELFGRGGPQPALPLDSPRRRGFRAENAGRIDVPTVESGWTSRHVKQDTVGSKPAKPPYANHIDDEVRPSVRGKLRLHPQTASVPPGADSACSSPRNRGGDPGRDSSRNHEPAWKRRPVGA